MHSGSQTVDTATVVEKAMVTVVKAMGSGTHASRKLVKVQESWDFDRLLNEMTKKVKAQVKHQLAVGKRQIKSVVTAIAGRWHEAGILCQQNGAWCFKLFMLGENERKAKKKGPSSTKRQPYVNRPQRQQSATV